MNSAVLNSVKCFLIGLYGGRHDQIDFDITAKNIIKNTRAAPFYLQIVFKCSFLFYNYIRPLFSLRFKKLESMPDAEIIHLITSWFENPIFLEKLVLTGLKYICVCELYTETPLQKEIGYFPAIDRRRHNQC